MHSQEASGTKNAWEAGQHVMLAVRRAESLTSPTTSEPDDATLQTNLTTGDAAANCKILCSVEKLSFHRRLVCKRLCPSLRKNVGWQHVGVGVSEFNEFKNRWLLRFRVPHVELQFFFLCAFDTVKKREARKSLRFFGQYGNIMSFKKKCHSFEWN